MRCTDDALHPSELCIVASQSRVSRAHCAGPARPVMHDDGYAELLMCGMMTRCTAGHTWRMDCCVWLPSRAARQLAHTCMATYSGVV